MYLIADKITWKLTNKKRLKIIAFLPRIKKISINFFSAAEDILNCKICMFIENWNHKTTGEEKQVSKNTFKCLPIKSYK